MRRAVFLFFFVAVAAPCGFAASPDDRRVESPAGPVYVPLDSWIYPALRRLSALGYTPDEDSLIAPWTRRQCRLLVDEAEDIASRHTTKVSDGKTREEALRLISALRDEFPAEENAGAGIRLESLYLRTLGSGGTTLRDSYHFGQTLVNDYGRPYADGLNTVAGFSAYGSAGRFSGYFRGEYQQAGGRAAYNPNTQILLGELDGVPAQMALGARATNRFEPLEAYVGMRLGVFDVTFGQQSLWWGPGEATAFHFSNNAAPMYALRLAQTSPILLPGPFRWLGHIRTEFVLGKLSGNSFPPRPFLNAQKITFQLTPNFEVGITRSAIFGGVGHPLTARSIFRSFFGTASTGNTAYGSASDPGDRRSGFDFRWRLPGLRRFVTIYSDSLADDEPNPLASPRRSAWGPGLYLAQLPGLRRLDFRLETYSTWLYRKDEGGQFFYWNNQYRDAYTNNGYLIGSWIGRDARTYYASSNYWWSSQNKLSVSFRQTKSGSNFLPGGGTQTDVGLTLQWRLRPELQATTSVQFERYFIPALGGPERNLTASVQLIYYPKRWLMRR